MEIGKWKLGNCEEEILTHAAHEWGHSGNSEGFAEASVLSLYIRLECWRWQVAIRDNRVNSQLIVASVSGARFSLLPSVKDSPRPVLITFGPREQ
jgi:hypothetical protein